MTIFIKQQCKKKEFKKFSNVATQLTFDSALQHSFTRKISAHQAI
jgi:hypothetical protein